MSVLDGFKFAVGKQLGELFLLFCFILGFFLFCFALGAINGRKK